MKVSIECRVFDYILDVDAIHLSVNVESPAVHLHLGDRNDYILPSIQSSNNTLSNLDLQTIRINGAGLARNISRDIKANSSFQIWTTELINSPLGGKAGVDDKRFLLATELADKKTVFHRFEKGQRVENFSLPDYESRILFESQCM